MAKIVQAVSKYGPRLKLSPTAQVDEIAAWIAMRTGLNKGEVMLFLQEMSELIIFFNRRGIPVKLPGVGIFKPTIDRHGSIHIRFRSDNALKEGIRGAEDYQGEIRNARNIGIDNAAYKELWDAEHPDDPLEI